MPHVMVDLETLGNGNDASILSIGAVKFNDEEIIDRFHAAVDPVSCEQLGLKTNADTVMWWLHPDRADARASLLDNETVDLGTALYGFSQWFGNESMPLWGNGATFDNVILRSGFKAAGIEYPAKFWHDWCYRTVKNMAPEIPLERIGVHHNALDDAESQARHLQMIAKHLGINL